MAARVAMSPSNFLRHFGAQVGIGPKHWLRRERVAAAQALLERPFHSPCRGERGSTDSEVLLLVGGEAPKQGSRIYYPLNPSRRDDMDPMNWWSDVPKRELGPHDAMPTRRSDD